MQNGRFEGINNYVGLIFLSNINSEFKKLGADKAVCHRTDVLTIHTSHFSG